MIGYQKGTTDGFNPSWTGSKQIDDPYLDEVSITYGKPCKHLWSLGMGACPCSKSPGLTPPEFVRDYYYCDGTAVTQHSTYYPKYTVWDGEGCSSENSCCSQAGMLHFYRRLPLPVSENIEVRPCNNQAFSDEAVFIGAMELYVL